MLHCGYGVLLVMSSVVFAPNTSFGIMTRKFNLGFIDHNLCYSVSCKGLLDCINSDLCWHMFEFSHLNVSKKSIMRIFLWPLQLMDLLPRAFRNRSRPVVRGSVTYLCFWHVSQLPTIWAFCAGHPSASFLSHPALSVAGRWDTTQSTKTFTSFSSWRSPD